MKRIEAYSDCRKKIVHGIKKAQENGFKLVSGYWGRQDDKCGCALGCMLMADNYDIDPDDAEMNAEYAAEFLHVPLEYVESFIDGFDHKSPTEGIQYLEEAFNLGREINKLFSPQEMKY